MKRADKFLPYAQQIKALGYRVFIPEDEQWRTYCFIADVQGRVGYCQLGDYDYGVRFSTIHKSKTEGTGFSCTDWDKPVMSIRREHVEASLAVAPSWVSDETKLKIEKWNITDFLDNHWGKLFEL